MRALTNHPGGFQPPGKSVGPLSYRQGMVSPEQMQAIDQALGSS